MLKIQVSCAEKTDMNKRHILFTSRQEAQEKLR